MDLLWSAVPYAIAAFLGFCLFFVVLEYRKTKRRYELLTRKPVSTQSIASMVERGELSIPTRISTAISRFLRENEQFDFAVSHIDDFCEEIGKIAGDDAGELIKKLREYQRTFPLSPEPDSVGPLLEKGFDSPSAIASRSPDEFIERFGPSLGGAEVALAIHERASLINRYIGPYRGIVTDNNDPSDRMRIRARVLEVLGEVEAPWVSPRVPQGARSVPDVGDGVWIEFEAGDLRLPIWAGR